MDAFILIQIPWPILSDGKYSMVEEAWKLAIEAQDCQWALSGASAGTPWVCEVPNGPFLKIDPQTREAVSSGFCVILVYQIYDIDYPPNDT